MLKAIGVANQKTSKSSTGLLMSTEKISTFFQTTAMFESDERSTKLTA